MGPNTVNTEQDTPNSPNIAGIGTPSNGNTEQSFDQSRSSKMDDYESQTQRTTTSELDRNWQKSQVFIARAKKKIKSKKMLRRNKDTAMNEDQMNDDYKGDYWR